MAGPRHQGRELALKVLFQLESPASEPDLESALEYHAEEASVSRETREFARELVDGVLQHQGELDGLIETASEHWRLDQMAKVDRAILRIATFEIAMRSDVPVRAAINESIELAKTFSGEEAGRFVNGVLGRVAESAQRP